MYNWLFQLFNLGRFSDPPVPIQVSLALINTLMLQEVLAEEQWKNPMKQEDWRGLGQSLTSYQKLCRTYLLCGYEASSLTQGL